jgi:hypothetical protein
MNGWTTMLCVAEWCRRKRDLEVRRWGHGIMQHRTYIVHHATSYMVHALRYLGHMLERGGL